MDIIEDHGYPLISVGEPDVPWRGPTTEEWLDRISPWPTPWIGGIPDMPLAVDFDPRAPRCDMRTRRIFPREAR